MVLEVKIVSADVEDDYYVVSYLVENPNGVVRRSRTIYSAGKMSRKEKGLKDKIKEAIKDYKIRTF